MIISARSERVITIYAVVKELQHVFPPNGGSGAALLPGNGNNAGRETNVSSVEASVQSVRFDHNGDTV